MALELLLLNLRQWFRDQFALLYLMYLICKHCFFFWNQRKRPRRLSRPNQWKRMGCGKVFTEPKKKPFVFVETRLKKNQWTECIFYLGDEVEIGMWLRYIFINISNYKLNQSVSLNLLKLGPSCNLTLSLSKAYKKIDYLREHKAIYWKLFTIP